MADILGILSGLGSILPAGMSAITGLVDRVRANIDPTMQLMQENQMQRYTDAVTGGYNPYGDPYGGYGQFGQMNGQNMSPFQAQQFALSGMMNNQQNPMQAYQQNLAQLMGMGGPQMQNPSAGMANLLGYGQQQQPQRQMGFNPYMPQGPSGTNQSGQAQWPSRGYPGAEVGNINSLLGLGINGQLPVIGPNTSGGNGVYNKGATDPSSPGASQPAPAAGQNQQALGNQYGQGMSMRPGQGFNIGGGPQRIVPGVGNPADMKPGITQPQNPGQPIGPSQNGNWAPQSTAPNNTAGMLQNPYARNSLLAPQTFGALANQGIGQYGQRALNQSVQQPGAMGNLVDQANKPGLMTYDLTQRAQQGVAAPQAMNALQNTAGAQGGVTGQALSNPRADLPSLLSSLAQQAQGGTAGLMQQLQSNPMSMTPEVQNQIFNRAQETNDAASMDLQRRMRENAAASGNANTGEFNQNMYDAEQERIRNLGNIRRDVGIQAAQTNFGDLLNATGMQQQDLGRQFQNLQGATGMQQDVNQSQFGNMLQSAGLEESQAGRLYGQQYNLAGLQNQLGQQDYQNFAQAAGAQQTNLNRMFGNQMNLAGFQNQLGQQQFGNQMEQAGLENQYGQQALQNLMQGTGLEQGMNQQQWQNQFNTGQAQFGMEQALGQQQFQNNDQAFNQWLQNAQRQQGLSQEMANAGMGNEQRTQDLWSQLTGGAQQGMDYENSLLNQIGNMQMWRLSPSPMANINFQMPQNSGGGGGGGGGNNQLLAMLAQMAGSYMGGQ